MNIIFNDDDIHISSLIEVADLFRSQVSKEDEESEIEVSVEAEGAWWRAKAEISGEMVSFACADTKAYAAKLCVYNYFKKITTLRPAWGSLTGVKPLKLMVKLKEAGFDERYSREYFKRNFDVSDEKIDLLLSCMKNQLSLLYPKKNTYSLYIHIPLCLSKCSYCSFPSAITVEGSELCGEYLAALIKELEAVIAFFPEMSADCVYIGGGTPSVLGEAQVRVLLSKIKELCPNAREITYEAGRADTLSVEKLAALKEGGVTRISLNPQTTNDKTLMGINRRVSFEDFLSCFRRAREIGLNNINCDLIFGLEGEGREDYFKSLNEIIALSPESITLHTLCKKRTSDIDIKEHDRREAPIAKYMNEAVGILASYGYAPYYLYRQKHALDNAENIGFAKDEKGCIYNVRMMGERQSVLSAGAASTSKIYFPEEDRFENVYNIKNIRLYIDNIDSVIEKKLNTLKKLTEK